MPLPLDIMHFAGAAETAYADGTLAGLTGSDILPIDPGATFVYHRQKHQRNHSSGGFGGARGAPGAKWCDINNLNVELVPTTISAALSERPTCDPFLLASNWHVTTENHVGDSEYRVKYRLAAKQHASNPYSMAAILQALNETGAAALEYATKGIRFNSVISCPNSEIIKAQLTGHGVNPTLAHQGTPVTPSAFPDEVAIVHQAAALTMTAKASGGDVVFAGELLELELNPNFRLEVRRTGSATDGGARVKLVKGRPTIKVSYVAETMNAFNAVSFMEEPCLIELTSRWSSVANATDKVELLATFDIGDDGIAIESDDQGEAKITLSGDLAWGIPGESHLDPKLSGAELRFLTTY